MTALPDSVEILHLRFEHGFPARQEPEWKGRVDRWYQMDHAAYGLCEAYWAWKDRIGSAPSLILLASPGASNRTDRAFAETGATSPSRFVHTLPNIRSSPLCQVMGWNGPVLCLQKDPTTVQAALAEAAELVEAGWPSVWVLSSSRSGPQYTVDGYFLRPKDAA